MNFPMFQPQTVFDPSRFGDPLALQIEWSPIGSGGANFCTHRLTASGQNKMKFRLSAAAIIFNLLFLTIGIGLMIISAFSEIILVLMGLVFACIGGALLVTGFKHIVFDKAEGYFYKGTKKPDPSRPDENFVGLGNIHAIQLLSSYHTGKNSYYTYEINLVLNNCGRVSVISHGNRRIVKNDAHRLSLFLNVPVWSVIG